MENQPTTLEERVRRSARRGSAVEIIRNPLDFLSASDPNNNNNNSTNTTTSQAPDELSALQKKYSSKIEVITGAVPISSEELNEFVKILKIFESNEDVINFVEQRKAPYLFSTKDITTILNIVSSIRTKITIILLLSPRLTDPSVALDSLIKLFRYSDEKKVIEDAIKARILTINRSVFKNSTLSSSLSTSTTVPFSVTELSAQTSSGNASRNLFAGRGMRQRASAKLSSSSTTSTSSSNSSPNTSASHTPAPASPSADSPIADALSKELEQLDIEDESSNQDSSVLNQNTSTLPPAPTSSTESNPPNPPVSSGKSLSSLASKLFGGF